MDKPIQGAGFSTPVDVGRRTGDVVPGVPRVRNQPDASIAKAPGQPRVEDSHVAGKNVTPRITTLEAALPIEILRSPVLMRTEWAWRRLLVTLTQEAAKETDHPGQFVPSGDKLSPTPRSWPNTEGEPFVHSTETATPPNELPSPGKSVREEELQPGLASTPLVKPGGQSALTGTLRALAATPSGQVPLAVAYGTTTEQVTNKLGPSQVPSADPNEAVQPSLAEMTVKALWTALSALSSNNANTDWGTSLPTAYEQGAMIPFTNFKQGDLTKDVPEKVKNWTLADRLVSATRTPDMPQVGGGLFVLPDARGDRQNAVRWQAERRTRTTSQGQAVHHLSMEVHVGNEPVNIDLLCARPSLSIRVETNHVELKRKLELQLHAVKEALSNIGWRLDRWTLGHLQSPGEEES